MSQKDEILNLYNQGYAPKFISEKLNIDRDIINVILKIALKKGIIENHGRKFHKEVDNKKILELYLSGIPVQYMSGKLGETKQLVQSRLDLLTRDEEVRKKRVLAVLKYKGYDIDKLIELYNNQVSIIEMTFELYMSTTAIYNAVDKLIEIGMLEHRGKVKRKKVKRGVEGER